MTLAVFVCGSLVPLALSQSLVSIAASPSPHTVDELTVAVAKEIAENGIPGVGLALVSKGELFWAGGVGKADVETGEAVTADTLFRVGSISKSVVALAVLKLREEGRLDLDAKLANVAPEIPIFNRFEDRAPLRVIHLLEDTAGFDDVRFNDLAVSGPEAHPPLRAVLSAHPGSRTARWEPGTRASYSNPGYAVAGFVIEKAARMPFEDYVKAAVFDPIGMTASTFGQVEFGQKGLARGYVNRSFTPAPALNMLLRPAGALVSSSQDLGSLVRFLLNRGSVDGRQVLHPASLIEMETVHTTLAARAGLINGYGLGNDVDLQFPLQMRGHDGGVPGYSAHFRDSIDHGFGYALLFNTTAASPARQRIQRLLFAFLSQGIPRGQSASAPLAARDLAPLTGYYGLANPKDELFAFRDALLGGVRVSVRHGQLTLQAFGQPPEALTPISPKLFRRQDEPDASIVFVSGANGDTVMVADAGWSY